MSFSGLQPILACHTQKYAQPVGGREPRADIKPARGWRGIKSYRAADRATAVQFSQRGGARWENYESPRPHEWPLTTGEQPPSMQADFDHRADTLFHERVLSC